VFLGERFPSFQRNMVPSKRRHILTQTHRHIPQQFNPPIHRHKDQRIGPQVLTPGYLVRTGPKHTVFWLRFCVITRVAVRPMTPCNFLVRNNAHPTKCVFLLTLFNGSYTQVPPTNMTCSRVKCAFAFTSTKFFSNTRKCN